MIVLSIFIFCNWSLFISVFVILPSKTFKMSRQIKLIWDFRGPASAKTAEHHEIHLKEYIAIEKLLEIAHTKKQGKIESL